MSNKISVVDVIDDVKNKWGDVQKAIDDYENRISQLEQKYKKAQNSIEEAEEKIKNAQRNEKEAIENYNKAIELQKGEYGQLINELFEQPKTKLQNDIRQQAKSSIRYTLIVAVLTVIVSLLISFYQQQKSIKSANDLISKIDETFKTINSIDLNTKNILEEIDNFSGSTVQILSQTKKYYESITSIDEKSEKLLSNIRTNIDEINNLTETSKITISSLKDINTAVASLNRNINQNIELLTGIDSNIKNSTLSLSYITENLDNITSAITKSEKETKILLSKFANYDSSLSEINSNTSAVLKEIISKDPDVNKILEALRAERNDFNFYQTKNDLSLAYKIRIALNSGINTYDNYIKAFNLFDINKSIIPSQSELRQWDKEISDVSANAYNKLLKLPTMEVSSKENRYYQTHKKYSDSTDYGGWHYSNESITNGELMTKWRKEYDFFKKQLEYN